MLKSTARLLFQTHMFFDEIGYEPNSENLNGDELFDCLINTINHAKTFKDAIATVRMYDDYIKREEKFLKKYFKYPEFWDSIEYSGREEIAVVDDAEAIGTYYITNIFNTDYKSINVFGQSFGDDIYGFTNEGGYYSLGVDTDYYLRYSKMSSAKMVIADKNRKNVATVVLSKDNGIFLENNKTRYELEIYDIGIAFFEKEYVYSLSKSEEPDLDKHCKGFIQWDIVDDKGNYGFSRLEVYDENADLDLMLFLSAACFLAYRAHMKSIKASTLIPIIVAGNMIRRH